MTAPRTEQEWTVRTVRHPHGPTSRLWVSPDKREYKVFEHGPAHPMNRLTIVPSTEGDEG